MNVNTSCKVVFFCVALLLFCLNKGLYAEDLIEPDNKAAFDESKTPGQIEDLTELPEPSTPGQVDEKAIKTDKKAAGPYKQEASEDDVTFEPNGLEVEDLIEQSAKETEASPKTNPFGIETGSGHPRASELQLLFEKIKELEEEVGRLKDITSIRRKLELTEEEKRKKEKEILTAVSRAYVLPKERSLEIEYNGSYSYTASDRLNLPGDIQHSNNHTFRHTLLFDYAVKDNFTVNFGFPFVYKYDQTGSDNALTESGLGNITFGVQWQPKKTTPPWPTTILFLTYSADTGSSAFDIDPAKELGIAAGYDSITTGVSLSKPVDPVVVYGSLSYSYNDDITGINKNVGGGELTKVSVGDGIGLSLGMGYSISYQVSMNMGLSYFYSMKSRNYFTGLTQNTASSTSSTFSIGTGWVLSPKRSLNVSVGMGLTSDAPDLTLTVRIPFSFML
jgi:hypothetical protein